jgi:hypothetical protein
MDKPNIFRTSEFYMADGDVLHIELADESGDIVEIELTNKDNPTETVPTYSLEWGSEYSGTFSPSLAFYRNYEQNNSLALADYVGRTQAIQTPIILVEDIEDDGDYYVILANVPSIPDLINSYDTFMIYNMSIALAQPEHNPCLVSSYEYIGLYGSYSNCVKLGISPALPQNVEGDKIGLVNLKPGGMWRSVDVLLAETTGVWNATYTAGANAVWKRADGKYGMIVCGYNKDVSPKVYHHYFLADSPEGPWVDQTAADASEFGAAVVPVGFNAAWVLMGCVKLDDTHYAAATTLTDGSDVPTTPAIALWNEDMTDVSVVELNFDYVYEFGWGTSPWPSLGYYKGKFLYVMQDGDSGYTGKRIVLSSDTIDGEFTYHSTAIDYSDWSDDADSGNMFIHSVAHGCLFTIANKLYLVTEGESYLGNAEAGEYANHSIHLWGYDEGFNEWSYIKGPIITAIHGFYSEMGFSYDLSDHVGYMAGFYVEDGKMWFCIPLCKGTDTYTLTNGYFDLDEVLL